MKTIKVTELKSGSLLRKLAEFELSVKAEYFCVVDGQQCKIVKL